MKIEMHLGNVVAETWQVDDINVALFKGIADPEERLQAIYEYRKGLIDKKLQLMEKSYDDLIRRMGRKVSFVIVAGSGVNLYVDTLTDQDLEDFECYRQLKLNEKQRKRNNAS